jgi:hypothetical protein
MFVYLLHELSVCPSNSVIEVESYKYISCGFILFYPAVVLFEQYQKEQLRDTIII